MRTRVLFICAENAVQSPAAEAILRAVGGDPRFDASSAGVTPTVRFESQDRRVAPCARHRSAARSP